MSEKKVIETRANMIEMEIHYLFRVGVYGISEPAFHIFLFYKGFKFVYLIGFANRYWGFYYLLRLILRCKVKKQAQKNGLYFLQTVYFLIYNYLIFTNGISFISLSPDNLEHYLKHYR